MSDDRNSDGTYKSSYVGDRQKQIDAGVEWGTNYSDAQQKVWEHDNKQWAASQERMRQMQQPNSKIDYTAFAGAGPVRIPAKIIGLFFLLAALVFLYFATNAYSFLKADNKQASFYPTSELVNLPEETDGRRGEIYSDLWGAMKDTKYLNPAFPNEPYNVFSHCENSGCTRPSSQELMKYVYPYINPGRENQQRVLSSICRLDAVRDAMQYGTQTIKFDLKPTDTGCLIVNYDKLKEEMAMSKSGFLRDAANMKTMLFTWIACLIASGLLGSLLLFKPSKKK